MPAQRAEGGVRRVALLQGCVQPALAPEIDQAAARLLERRGIALVPLEGSGCCGALAHHLGRRREAKEFAKRTIIAFERAGGANGFEAVLSTASGCAAHLADYPHLFEDEPEWKARSKTFSDAIGEFTSWTEPRNSRPPRRLRIAWQAPCSLQHGLKRAGPGPDLLRAAGFDVVEIPEGHLCCGSAGSYSILQPEISAQLRARKLAHIASLNVDAVASPNIGCLIHLSGPDAPPVIHPAELIDWAEGGRVPLEFESFAP